MALDRQSIERRDFPNVPNGYDPDAVHAHLARIAEEVEELRAASPGRGETLASSASEQVRAILEAAENSAAEIQRQATAQVRDYLGRVTESAQVIRQRLNAMEGELSALLEGRPPPPASAEPEALFESVPSAEPEAPAAPAAPAPPEAPPEPEAPAEPEAWARPEAPAAPEPETGPPGPAAPEPDPGDDDLAGGFRATGSGSAVDSSSTGDDTEGARLIALNMALNGTSREETDRYLSENFTLSDRAGLLDEVYASVQS